MHVRGPAIMRERARGGGGGGGGRWREVTYGLDSPARYNARIYKRAAYTREGALRHTYVRPDIDRQLATVTVYNSVRLVAAPVVVQPLSLVLFEPRTRAVMLRGRSEGILPPSILSRRSNRDSIDSMVESKKQSPQLYLASPLDDTKKDLVIF